MSGFSGTYAGNWLDSKALSSNMWNPSILNSFYANQPQIPYQSNLMLNQSSVPWNTEINGIQTSANSNQLFNLNADQQSKNSHADVCSICGKRLRLLNNQKLNTRSEVSSPTAECLACDIGCNNNPNPNTFSASCEKSLSAFTSYPGIFREEGKHEYQSVVELFTEEQGDDKNPVLICKYITDNLIGKDTVLHTPFGYFKVIYLDYTASGRNVKFIEAFIRQHVLPVYANTHSESSCCSEQTEKYREEARSIIRRCVNASDKDVVLFVGTGTTGAIHKIVDTLNLKTGHTNKVTLVLSALEHHSNILPWKESGVEVIRIPLNKEGNMCIGTLTKTLKKLSSENRIILCSFTAASNVTGILLDVDNISSIVHSYGGYVFWDYAAAAPYIKINMNTSDSSYKDAIFLSGHKFIGGPGSPGVLIAKYFLFKNPVPTNPGGGAVLMVTKSTHIYLGNIEKREEGGTPDIIGSIRFGLAFQLKRSIGDKYIEMREQVLCEKFFNRLSSNRRIIILGNCKQKRLPIFSFLIVHQVSGLLLHHNFIARILNDLFGIQGRPGCVCAGPYTQDLLDIDEEFALKLVALQSSSSCKDINGSVNGNIKNENMNSLGIMKAGFTRISLPFFFSDSMINEIIDIIQFVADNGWYFLPQYTYELNHGTWYHRTFDKKYNSLEKITYENGKMYFEALVNNGTTVTSLLSNALNKLREAKEIVGNFDFSSDPRINLGKDEEIMRWFILPSEAAKLMVTGKIDKHGLPFVPIDGKDKVKAIPGAIRTTEEKDKIYISKKKKDKRMSPDKKPKI